jgi:hypothetical protein
MSTAATNKPVPQRASDEDDLDITKLRRSRADSDDEGDGDNHGSTAEVCIEVFNEYLPRFYGLWLDTALKTVAKKILLRFCAFASAYT